jgi:uncharacterized protein involved in exopolysaccharide biosynthesis
MDEPQQTRSPFVYGDEIDLRELFRPLWTGKWLIAGVTTASAIVSVAVALLLPDIYRAEALLAPNDEDRAGGLSALAAQYGGLATLAGIEIDSGKRDKTALGIEVMKSRKFLMQFVEDHDLLVPLIAAKGWSPASDELEIDSEMYDMTAGKWIREVRPPSTTIPSKQEAYREFSKILSVTQDSKAGFIVVAVEHYSPKVAKQWVDWLVDDINSTIMKYDVAEAEQAITYLNEQIASTSLAGLQSVFYNLIEEQTKTILLANVSKEYLFRTIDPAVAPEKRAKPKRKLIVILGTFLGLIGSVIVVMILFGGSTRRRSQTSN